jgi:putative transposase
MIRGLERREIFRDDDDRWDLIDRLGRLVPKWGGLCFAWAFMPNHAHFALRTEALPLAWLMRRLNTGFARRFNERHDRVGYLFQNRFKSRLVNDDADLLNLLRYVHLNPVRGGLATDVADLERYPWSGHGALIGTRAPFLFEHPDKVLELFCNDRTKARGRLIRWMALPPDVERGLSPVFDLDYSPFAIVPAEASPRAPARSLEELMSAVCRRFSTEPWRLTRGARDDRTSRARAVIAFVAVCRLQLSIQEICESLGASPQAIGRAIERGYHIDREEGPFDPREGS